MWGCVEGGVSVCVCTDFAVVFLNFSNIFFCFYLFFILERLFKVAFLIYFMFGFHLRFLHLLLLLLLLFFASVYILL